MPGHSQKIEVRYKEVMSFFDHTSQQMLILLALSKCVVILAFNSMSTQFNSLLRAVLLELGTLGLRFQVNPQTQNVHYGNIITAYKYGKLPSDCFIQVAIFRIQRI